jgi:VWFA-related protein
MRLLLAVALLSAMRFVPASSQGSLSIVPIEVAVTGPGGESVIDLSREEFELAIDGKPTAVAAFTPPPAPIAVVLLLDVSASLSNYGDIGDEIERSFAPALEPVDRARVGGIASRLKLSPRFTSVRRELVSGGRTAIAFRRDEKFGPSPIWDALDATIATLEPEAGRRAVIMVTDGRSTGNAKGSVEVMDRAIASGTVVHVLSEARTIVIRQGETSYARVRSGLMLEELARQTGGLCLPENSPAAGELPKPGPIIAALVKDLREMYTLGVAQVGPSGSVHRIAVRVKRPGLTVRTRTAYRTR